MSLGAFEEGLDSYGANLARWPADKRAGAECLLAQSAEAKAAWHDAQLIGDFLEARAETGPQSDLVERVMAAQHAHDATMPVAPHVLLRAPWPGLLRAGLLCGVFLVGGATAGLLAAPDVASYDISGAFLFSSDLFYI